MTFYKKQLSRLVFFSLAAVFAVESANALVIEEVNEAELERRSLQAEQLIEPIMQHVQNLPTIEGDAEPLTVADGMAIYNAANQLQREQIVDSKFSNIEKDLHSQVIGWLEKEISLEKQMISQLKTLPQADAMCKSSISSYQKNSLAAMQDTVDHLKKYRTHYKAEKFLVMWVFNFDYIARIQIRQEPILLANICANPGVFTNEIFSQPLAEATYVGKPIEPSLRK